MTYNLLAGGYRNTFAYLSFEPSSAKLKLVSESPSPENASWIEASTTKFKAPSRVLYSLSEDAEKGVAVSLELKGEEVKITQERKTNVHCMKDGSGIVSANYVGGSILFFPVESDGSLSSTSNSPPLKFPFPYEGKKKPNEERQDASHPHQVYEAANGTLYVPDLGSDRIWVVEREGAEGLAIKGYLQAPEGSGPRHCQISDDGKHLYVLTELSSSIFIYSLENPTYPTHPLPDVQRSILPPSVPSTHAKYMDAAELACHPTIPNVLYASNRYEMHLDEKAEGLLGKVKDLLNISDPPKGDGIAIVLLDESGSRIEQIKHVRTECDAVRAMRVSPDGKYVALGGQEGGGVELWSISGERGDEWKLAAKNPECAHITDIVWV